MTTSDSTTTTTANCHSFYCCLPGLALGLPIFSQIYPWPALAYPYPSQPLGLPPQSSPGLAAALYAWKVRSFCVKSHRRSRQVPNIPSAQKSAKSRSARTPTETCENAEKAKLRKAEKPGKYRKLRKAGKLEKSKNRKAPKSAKLTEKREKSKTFRPFDFSRVCSVLRLSKPTPACILRKLSGVGVSSLS